MSWWRCIENLNILALQHVVFETPALIAEWAAARGHVLTVCRVDESASLPAVDSFDILVVMGGPMGVHDVAEHPWLVAEKALIKSAIDAGKYVLGVCLGAQLIADILGAKVYPNPVKEIGWMPVAIPDSALGQPVLAGLNNAMTVFHWHGDTFELPTGATHLMASSHCRNQAFIYERKVLGLQFHLEMTEQGVHALITHCGHELVESAAIHNAEKLQAGTKNIPACKTALFNLLDNLTA